MCTIQGGLAIGLPPPPPLRQVFPSPGSGVYPSRPCLHRALAVPPAGRALAVAPAGRPVLCISVFWSGHKSPCLWCRREALPSPDSRSLLSLSTPAATSRFTDHQHGHHQRHGLDAPGDSLYLSLVANPQPLTLCMCRAGWWWASPFTRWKTTRLG